MLRMLCPVFASAAKITNEIMMTIILEKILAWAYVRSLMLLSNTVPWIQL